jgi:hypothetical protein
MHTQYFELPELNFTEPKHIMHLLVKCNCIQQRNTTDKIHFCKIYRW